jgi:hypothetical protein
MKVENIRKMQWHLVWVYQDGEHTVYEIIASFVNFDHARYCSVSFLPLTGVYEVWKEEKFATAFR